MWIEDNKARDEEEEEEFDNGDDVYGELLGTFEARKRGRVIDLSSRLAYLIARIIHLEYIIPCYCGIHPQ